MRFPRITCTLGRATDEPAVLRGMVERGMGLARINTAYPPLDEIAARIDGLRAAADVPVMLDLRGPKLRVECTTEKAGRAVPCRYPIAAGDRIVVGFGTGPVRFQVRFEVSVGDAIRFDNGTIDTRVLEVREDALLLDVLNPGGGFMTPRMGANVPGRRLDVPRLSPRDREAIALGVEKRVEWFALSFTRDAGDVTNLLAALAGSPAGVILKIEDAEGVRNLEASVAAVGKRPVAVMIARGDLFVELPRTHLPRVQADLVARCRALGVPSVVATGFLQSMQERDGPTRAEVCDVAAALAQGADGLLLSDETANGRPIAAVSTLAELIKEHER